MTRTCKEHHGRGLGTLINVACIVAGGSIGLLASSLVGSTLIFCVGVNLIWPRTFKPANMLPAVVIAVILALV